MAYYEVLIPILLSILLGLIIGYNLGKKEVQVKDYRDGYKEGFNDAKRLYYDDPKKEKELESEIILEEIKKQNEVKPKITPELLMAYGVSNTSHLPKNVKEYYGLIDKPPVDLETLIEEEQNDRN